MADDNRRKLAARIGAHLAIEIHGAGATPEHARTIVYEGRAYTPENFADALIETARHTNPVLADLSDEDVAASLLARMGHVARPTPEA